MKVSAIGFGLKPCDKHQALVTLKDDDLAIRFTRPGEYDLIVSPELVEHVKDTFEATGGVVAFEDLYTWFDDFIERRRLGFRPMTMMRKFTLALMEPLAQDMPRWKHFNKPYAARIANHHGPFRLKAVYDKDRRATVWDTRHIHHAHFDPDYYAVVGLLDGPFNGIEPGHQNRWLLDSEEVRQQFGELPQGFGAYPYYARDREINPLGIEINSNEGSLVIHDAKRFLHWTEGQAGSQFGNYQRIIKYPNRTDGDSTRTPFGFIGMLPTKSKSRYETARLDYPFQRSQFILGRSGNTSPSS